MLDNIKEWAIAIGGAATLFFIDWCVSYTINAVYGVPLSVVFGITSIIFIVALFYVHGFFFRLHAHLVETQELIDKLQQRK